MSLPDQDRPPVFGSWSSWYSLVICVLVIQIIAYYLLTVFLS